MPYSTIAWSECGSDLQCGTLSVPLDYADPGGTHIALAVERHPAEVPSERIGSLVINPGGPGDSGIDDLPSELEVLTPGLLERFDIVEFDPRGVDRSDPVSCTPATTTTIAATTPSSSTVPLAPTSPDVPGLSSVGPDPVPQDQQQINALVASDRAYGQACLSASGPLLRFVGTEQTARDLEVLRQALGDPKLTFIGHSYGTMLGAVYAQLYPDRVRAMVLDGALDPSQSTLKLSLEQAEGFESVLNQFFGWCAGSSACSWRPAGDPTAALLALVAQASAHPIPASGGQYAGPGDVYYGVLDSLYSESSWPGLGAALVAAEDGNGTPLLELTGRYFDHGGSNSGQANEAITCVDHPVPTDLATYPAAAEAAATKAPFFGPLLAWGALGCAVWPVPPSRDPAPANDPGAPPVLVTGATGDPATPYSWAQSMAGQLHGVLLTWDGIDHVAYYYSSCVRAIDQTYLIDLTLPAPGTVCH